MTQRSIKEYAEVMRRRYLKANRREKGRLLDEFVQVTGYHRKSAIRILLGRGKFLKSPSGEAPEVWFGGSPGAQNNLGDKRLHLFPEAEALHGRADLHPQASWGIYPGAGDGGPTLPNEPVHHGPFTTSLSMSDKAALPEHYQAGQSPNLHPHTHLWRA